jgi:hypothetical protein
LIIYNKKLKKYVKIENACIYFIKKMCKLVHMSQKRIKLSK